MNEKAYTRSLQSVSLAVLLLGFYVLSYLLDWQPAAIWLSATGLLFVVWISAAFPLFAGITISVLVGFFSTWRLFFEQVPLFSVEIIQAFTLTALPAVIFWSLHPMASLIIFFAVGRLNALQAGIKKENETLLQQKQRYEQQLKQQESVFQELCTKRVYRSTLSDQLINEPEIESIIGVLISEGMRRIREQLKDTFLLGAAKQKSVLEKPFFDLLIHLRPDVVAILSLKGEIIALNDLMMAIFGYAKGSLIAGQSFFECLTPTDQQRAIERFNQSLATEFNPGDRYQIRASDKAFKKLIIDPTVSFLRTGDPLAVLVLAHDSLDQSKENIQKPAIKTLHQNMIWCLDSDQRTLYIDPYLADKLHEDPHLMIHKAVSSYVSRQHQRPFAEYLKELSDGLPRQIDLMMQPRGGQSTAFRMTAWPAVDEDGNIHGSTLCAVDISDRVSVEEILQHRLKMEQMISSISKQLVSVQADKMDDTIMEVLSRIGAFENAIESTAEIFQSSTISRHTRYHVQQDKKSANNKSAHHADDYETVSIPIVIDNERLGFFHFSVAKYQSNWLEKDINLIRLIGEIFISALIRKEHELNVQLNEKRLFTTIRSIGDGVIATDTENLIINMNPSAENMTGWSLTEAMKQPLTQIMRTSQPIIDTPSRSTASSDDDQVHDDSSIRLWSRNGTQYFIAVTSSSIADQSGTVYGNVIVFRDITQEKQKVDEIRYISYHDNLTGLYNRTFFEEELVRLNVKRQYPITLVLGDCNGLKITNDIFGHLEGDRLLVSIGQILKKVTRQEDIVARWGGDEFAIILPKTDEATAATIRERILKLCELSEPSPIKPSLALGFATNTDGSDDLQQLLKLAEDRMYRHKLMEGKSARNAILQSIKKMIYEKSYETEEHASRMVDIAQAFGRAIDLSVDDLEELSLLAVLHDMGKIGIPDQILKKTDKLNEEEWKIMKKHPEKGYNIAKSTPELSGIATLILHHHEHWDGFGYPDGLKGEKIPKLSRILSIVDAYDVITHHRPYKQAQSKHEALDELIRCVGTQFDPYLVRIFVSIMEPEHHWLASESGSPTEKRIQS